MTDHHDIHRNDTMTGNNEHEDDPAIEGDTFEEHTVRRLGELGGDSLEEIHRETDIGEMNEETDIIAYQVCTCGNTLGSPEETYRCSNCTEVACTECRIRLNRYTYCPRCVRDALGVDRDIYLALYLLDRGVIEPVDLVTPETIGTENAEIHVDDTASTLLDNDLIRTDTVGSPISAAFDDNDPLTADGKQALEIGKKLYGDDPDIQTLERKITIHQVAENGR